ncbi:hypothetical protein EQG41_06170 [Billgrantia azerbaijanica]|nr:hypothetical protein EQG41_06170 [Halomonas azerbaijanica]
MTTTTHPTTALPASTGDTIPAWKGGSAYSATLTAAFALLTLSGLYLEFLAASHWAAGKLVLVLHLLGGALFTLALAPWLLSHVRSGPARSQRRLFTLLGWALLGKYLVVIATGLLMALPPALYLLGHIWFWRFETSDLLSFLHLWFSIAAALGVVTHLTLRHWKRAASPTGGHRPHSQP